MNTITGTSIISNRTTKSTRTINAKAVLAAVVMTAGALVPTAAHAGPVEDVEQRCLAQAAGSADSRERWVDHCRDVAGQYRTTYHDCMRNAPGSADSLERWVDHCAAIGSADGA